MCATTEPSTVYDTLKSGGKEEILEMLQQKIDQKYMNSDGDTLLHALLRNKILMETEIIEVLYLFLIQCANPNVKNKQKMTVLHLAVARRMENVFNALLKLRADKHVVDDNTNTLAHFFINDEFEKIKQISKDPVRNTAKYREKTTNESLKFLEFLISKNIDFDRKNNQGRSALHLAIAYSLQHFVPHLLKYTKDVKSADTDDQTLLELLLESSTLARRTQLLGENSYFECNSSYVVRSLQILFERGVSLVNYDERGRLIFLKVFAEKREMDIIETLINHCLNNCCDSNFSTALFCELVNCCTWWDNSETEYFLTVLSDLLSKGASVNSENQSRNRPVQSAIEANNFRLLKFLSERGAILNFKTAQGQNLLHLLAEQKFSDRDFYSESWYLIVRGNCEVNAMCNGGKSPLQTALARGNMSMALALIDLGAEINCKDDDDSQTPLHKALAIDKSGELAELLMRSGADVNAADSEGDTPLHLAVSNANLPIVRLLVEHDACVNSANRRIETPLHRAVMNESMAIVELLLASGADVNAKDREGNTPLLVHCAASYVSISIIELLMEYGASVECKNINLESALHRVAKHDGSVAQVVDFLLAKGVDATAEDSQGNTPLLNHCATSNVSLSIVQSFIDHGASVKCKNAREETPLHRVVKNAGDAAEVVRLLLEKGAEVNARDRRGNTPLLNHFTVADLDLPIVRTLIWHRADVNVRNRFSMQTPLHRAVVDSEAAIVELLIDAGADVNAEDYKGNTPAHYVFDRLTAQSARILELFLMKGHGTVRKLTSAASLRGQIPAPKNMAKDVMKYIAHLNESYVRYLIPQIVAKGDSVSFEILFSQHKLKIRAANLPFAEERNEAYNKVPHKKKFNHHSPGYYDACLREIEKLKDTHITSSRKSLYEFLRARPTDARLYVKNELLRQLIESEDLFTEFPKYAVMIRANYREALARESLMESAKEAWYALTKVQLPDILDHIFDHLIDVDLVNVIEASEHDHIVSAMRAMAI